MLKEVKARSSYINSFDLNIIHFLMSPQDFSQGVLHHSAFAESGSVLILRSGIESWYSVSIMCVTARNRPASE